MGSVSRSALVQLKDKTAADWIKALNDHRLKVGGFECD